MLANSVLMINGRECDLNIRESLNWLEESGKPHLTRLAAFLREWAGSNEYITQQTSGSTGAPKQLRVRRSQMLYSAGLTIGFFGLRQGMTALLCMSPEFIGGRMMVVRALLAGMNLLVIEPDENPLKALNQKVDFAAMVPFQFARSLKENPERFELVDKLILGGAPLPAWLEEEAQQLRTQTWHTYGMSETLSHIALRPVNGPQRSARFTPLPGVSLSLDDRSCLVVDAPHLNDEVLITNDIARIYPDGSFEVLGRADLVIVSAGHKIHTEELEQQLAPLIDVPFVISSVRNVEAGELAVLVIGEQAGPRKLYELWRIMETSLKSKDLPRRIFCLEKIPLTGSGKPDRMAVKAMLEANA